MSLSNYIQIKDPSHIEKCVNYRNIQKHELVAELNGNGNYYIWQVAKPYGWHTIATPDGDETVQGIVLLNIFTGKPTLSYIHQDMDKIYQFTENWKLEEALIGEPNKHQETQKELTITVTDPVIKAFFEQMLFELEANKNKGDWREWNNIEEMVTDLIEHIGKCLIAMKSDDKERVKELLADSANILMFMANAGHVYQPREGKYKVVSYSMIGFKVRAENLSLSDALNKQKELIVKYDNDLIRKSSGYITIELRVMPQNEPSNQMFKYKDGELIKEDDEYGHQSLTTE